MKHTLSVLFFALGMVSLDAHAASVLINPTPPALQHVLGDASANIYYASGPVSGLMGSGAFYDKTDGYQYVVSDISTGFVSVDVSTNNTFTTTGNQKVVVTLSTTTTSGSEIPLTGASLATNDSNPAATCNSGSVTTCTGTRAGVTNPLSAIYSAGTTLRLTFKLSDLCLVASVGAPPAICSSTSALNAMSVSPATPVTNSQSINVTFSVLDTTTGLAGAVSATGTTAFTTSTTLNLTDAPPTITCPTSLNLQDYYYPGDGSVIINGSAYPTSSGASSAPVQAILLLADRGGIANVIIGSDTPPKTEVVDFLNPIADRQQATGFINSVPGPVNNGYFGGFYAQNIAGIFSYDGAAPTAPACSTQTFPKGAAGGDVASDGLLHAEAVNSVLTESKCFIATAAFHDGKAGPVMMLRQFRDQILSKFSWGRQFISTYYTYSPALAQWAWDKPIIRSAALHALAPVEFMAWAILKITHAEQLPSKQPYIDRVKKKLAEDDAAAGKTTDADESYTATLKKKLTASPTPSESYIDQVKKTLDPSPTPSESYTEKLKQTIPPEEETESPITKVKEGRDHPLEPKRPPITTGVSFMFGVAPGFKVENTNSVVNFQDMYGGPWQPDLIIRYERQLFHSENLGSFGLSADFGISYAEGFGQYQIGFGSNNSKQSRTKFSFVQIPVLVGGVYRFNLFRLVRPYAGVAVGSMGYTEIRTDGVDNKRGYSFIFYGRVGASLLLDFADKSTARDSYLSSGIQHSYLFAEYLNLNSVNKTGVTFARNGVYLGFLFEY